MYNLFSKRLNNKRKAFTLVELLVVIAILAILIAIVVMQTSTITDKAAVATHNINVRSLESAVMLAIADGYSPQGGENLVKDNANTEFEKAVAKYLKDDPEFKKVKSMLSKIKEIKVGDNYKIEIKDGEWNIFPGEVELNEKGQPELKK